MDDSREHRLEALREALKDALARKRAASAAVGRARKGGEPLDPVLAAMTEAARSYDAVRAELKEVEALLEPGPAEGEGEGEGEDRERFPPHFRGSRAPLDPDLESRPEDLPAAGGGHVIAPADGVTVADWQRWTENRSEAGPWHDRRWASVFTGALGAEDRSLVALGTEGGIRGVLPLFRLRSRLFGDFLVSSPYLNGGGPLSDHPRVAADLLEHATHLAGELGSDHVEVREFRPRAGWHARSDKVSMVLRLPPDMEAFESGLSSKVRSQARRGERAGAEIRFGTSPDLLRAFHRVFAVNMRDLGTPAYGAEFFSAILHEFGNAATIAVVRLGGAPVGCAFLVRHRDTMEVPWASTLRRVNPEGVAMYLYREVLRHAIASGCRWFDFGRSTEGSGTHRFKVQWGAEEVRHHWHYWMRDGGEPPRLNPDAPRFRLAVRAWKLLPVSVATRLGPRIVRHLP
jgi:serine/alanine adding enzyme